MSQANAEGRRSARPGQNLVVSCTATRRGLASLYATVGDAGTAVTWPQRAFEQRQVDVVSLTVEPTLAAVRHAQPVRDLARTLGLSDALGRDSR